jgi:type VI secretion system protein ImpH
MAAESRTEDPDVTAEVKAEQPIGSFALVEEKLREDPCCFQFFQAVRLLERINRDLEPLGGFVHPAKETVRFSVHNSLAFPASQIQSIEWPDEGPPRMMVNFMGLTGPLGVLPHFYTELLIERERAKDRGLHAFFDIFHHRMISLFYGAWKKHHLPVGYERDQEDRFSRYFMALVGLGTPGLERRQAVLDESTLFYTGLLGLQPRSPAALEQLLEDYFGVSVEVEQFVGAWYALERDNQCVFEDADSYSEQLGFGAIVGDEIWDQQSRIRIKLGPLTEEQYLDFLPSGTAYRPLRALAAFFSCDGLEFEAQLILKREEVRRCELGAEQAGGPQLGWVTWMKSGAVFDRDPGDTVLLLT